MRYKTVIALLLLLICTSGGALAEKSPVALDGDLDGNGVVDLADLAMLKAYQACSLAPSQIPALAKADVNRDGRVDAVDGPVLLRLMNAYPGSWYEDNPTYPDPRDDSADWQFSTPEAQGMDSAKLAAGGDSIAGNYCIFSFLVLRHDRIVYERYYHGMDKSKANNIHSASKSLLQALISLAIQKGQLAGWDTAVSTVLPDYFVAASADKKNITVRHLMQMSSGLQWVEDSTEYQIEKEPNWVQSVINLPQDCAPGSCFNYSTGNTHIASNVIQQATGLATHAFAADNLLDAMNITVEHWGCPDPQGIDSGGCNVYLTPREMAKFGLLYLRNGVWNGQQLIPPAAVAQAATPTWDVDSTYKYDTGWWSRTISGHSMYFAWGYGGQFIYVMPDLDIVLVTSENTAGSLEYEINSGNLIRNFIIPAVTGP